MIPSAARRSTNPQKGFPRVTSANCPEHGAGRFPRAHLDEDGHLSSADRIVRTEICTTTTSCNPIGCKPFDKTAEEIRYRYVGKPACACIGWIAKGVSDEYRHLAPGNRSVRAEKIHPATCGYSRAGYRFDLIEGKMIRGNIGEGPWKRERQKRIIAVKFPDPGIDKRKDPVAYVREEACRKIRIVVLPSWNPPAKPWNGLCLGPWIEPRDWKRFELLRRCFTVGNAVSRRVNTSVRAQPAVKVPRNPFKDERPRKLIQVDLIEFGDCYPPQVYSKGKEILPPCGRISLNIEDG